MLAGPDAARFVLVTQAHLFKPTFPKSKEALIGPEALFFHQGDYHLRLRKLVRAGLYPESLRRLVPGVQAAVVAALRSWADGGVVNTYNEMKKVFCFILIKIISFCFARDFCFILAELTLRHLATYSCHSKSAS